jgi:metal-responsive CopG/Arc/MetJ family transcriptional regulator
MTKIDTQIVHLNIPKNLLKKVEDYQIKNGLTTKTSAILELIRNGLKAK